MPTWEEIAAMARELPPDRQQELLDFARLLRERSRSGHALRGIAGLCEDLQVDLTSEDLAQARREMWGSFPRSDI